MGVYGLHLRQSGCMHWPTLPQMVVSHAHGTFEAAMKRYGPDVSRRSDNFKITDGEVAAEQIRRLRFDYTVHDGHPADVDQRADRRAE